jgi:hypothetical protein
MPARLHYFAKPLFREGGRWIAGSALPFLCATDAEAGGEMLAKLADGAVVYQQMGEPEFDVWDEPELLCLFGDVTESQVMPDAA